MQCPAKGTAPKMWYYWSHRVIVIFGIAVREDGMVEFLLELEVAPKLRKIDDQLKSNSMNYLDIKQLIRIITV